MRNILIFDFDGTVALGHGPVLAYARHVAAALGVGGEFVESIRLALDAGAEGCYDGYEVVRRAGEAQGADSLMLTAAYLGSRSLLATRDAPITSPRGLAQFLADVHANAERVLVTNAPNIRIADALDSLGLAGLFDRVVTDARKPVGLIAVLANLPADARVLSVGDVWHNDLAPAHARGHATALIGGFADPEAIPTFSGNTFVEVIPHLRSWIMGRCE